MQQATVQTRLRIVSIFVLLIGLVFIGKLFTVQLVHGERFREKADRQYVTPAGTTFDRGSIYFLTKDGEKVSAATLRTGYRLAIVPDDMTDPEAAFATLAPLVTLDREVFMKAAAKKGDPYEELATELSRETADVITELDIPGVRLYKQKWRSYPGDMLAAQTIGFLGYKGDELAGRYGLERFYDDTLKREDPDLYVNFFAEIFAGAGKAIGENEGRAGDIVLTIEPSVQTYLEEALRDIQEKWNSDSVGGIIINPKTGAIYAIGSTPSFDPNLYGQVKDISVFSNPHVERIYEMGSTLKPLIMAAGLETGAVTADTEYYDGGSIEVRDRTIYNFDRKGRGQVTMQDVLNQSLNTGMVYVQQHMTTKDFKNYVSSFAFGEKTGVDLPGEISGLTSNLDTGRDVEFANISFGQGIAMTPISMVRALSALGNGGYLPQPHVVQKIEYVNSLSKKIDYEKGPQVFTPETSDEITRMLVEVVDSTLLSGRAKLDYYSIAAKTGTAQIPAPGGGYYSDRNLHSFFGYFPAYDPEFLVFFYTMYPKGARYASETLAQPFMDTAKFLLHYYEVPPDREPLTSDIN